MSFRAVVVACLVLLQTPALSRAQTGATCDEGKVAFCEAHIDRWYEKITELREEVEALEASIDYCSNTTADTPTAATMGSILFEDPSTFSGQKGSLIMEETKSGLLVKGSFAGLEAGSSHWHIFNGDCDAPGPFLAHFDVPVNDNGYAALDLELSGLSLHDPTLPVQAVEVLSNSGRVACGGVWESVAVELDSAGAQGILLGIGHCPPCHIHVNGALGGLEPNATGVLRIHQGFDCDEVGDTFKYTQTFDPWENTTFVADERGNAQVNIGMEVFTVNGQYPIQGRAVVTYDASGTTPTSCGVLSTLDD